MQSGKVAKIDGALLAHENFTKKPLNFFFNQFFCSRKEKEIRRRRRATRSSLHPILGSSSFYFWRNHSPFDFFFYFINKSFGKKRAQSESVRVQSVLGIECFELAFFLIHTVAIFLPVYMRLWAWGGYVFSFFFLPIYRSLRLTFNRLA